MEKKKKLIVLGVILLIIVISGITYAILTWQSGNINIGINTNCFTIDYTKGNNISGSLKLINEEDLISNGKFTIKEGVGVSGVNIGIKSTCSIEGYGNILLNITNISSVFTTGDSKGALKYAVLKNTSTITDPTQISTASLLNQSFDIEKKGSITTSDTLKLLTKQLSNTELYKYIIVIYVDNNLAGNDVTSATFQGNISAEAIQGKLDLAKETLNHLNSLNSTITLASGTPDFTTVSGSNGVKYNSNGDEEATGVGDGTKGIYATQDDLGTSYYFRGAVDNNYVKFAGFYWRIVRINGDGSIRMIYAGTSAHANGESETDSYISKTAYNSSYNDNTYVGYMTGTKGATTYASAHSNTNNSTIKGVIDTWYKTNIEDKGYSSYVADAIYCNDRSIANNNATNAVFTKAGYTNTGLGYGTNETAYGGFKRNWVDHTPSLVCPNNNDKFTIDSTLGNGKLTYPVALITSDEIAYAGGLAYDYNTNSYITNTDVYLHTPSYYYWTLTPWAFAGGYSLVVYWNASGSLDGNGVSRSSLAARAAVSLLSDAITGGSGTMSDPFTVG